MLSVIMFSVIMLSVIMFSVIMRSVIMLSVIMLSVVMRNVVAPLNKLVCLTFQWIPPPPVTKILTDNSLTLSFIPIDTIRFNITTIFGLGFAVWCNKLVCLTHQPLGWKYLAQANTLAYYMHAIISRKFFIAFNNKHFIVMKKLKLYIIRWYNKLVCMTRRNKYSQRSQTL